MGSSKAEKENSQTKKYSDNIELLFDEDNPFKADAKMEDAFTICLSLTLYLLIGGLIFGGTMWVILKLHKDAASPQPTSEPTHRIFAPASDVNHEQINEQRLAAIRKHINKGALTSDSMADRIIHQRLGKPEKGKCRQSDFDAMLTEQGHPCLKSDQFVDWMFPITQMDSSLAVRRYTDWKQLTELKWDMQNSDQPQSFIDLLIDGAKALIKWHKEVDLVCDTDHPKRKEYVFCSLMDFGMMAEHLGQTDNHQAISIVLGNLMDIFYCLPNWETKSTDPSSWDPAEQIKFINKQARDWCEVEYSNLKMIIESKMDDDKDNKLIKNRPHGWKS